MTDWIVWFFYPKPIHHTLQGVRYQLEADNPTLESIEVHIEGTIQRKLTLEKIFKGTFEIDKNRIPPNVSGSNKFEITLNLLQNRAGYIPDISQKQNSDTSENYGLLFANDNFTQITIATLHKTINDTNQDNRNITIISAPSPMETKPLEISENVIRNLLHDPID